MALAEARVSSLPDTLEMFVSRTPEAKSATSRFVIELPVPLASIVLFVKVWVPARVATVPSIFNVAAPLVAPPDNPVPATTEVISPVGTVATWVST